MTAPVGEVITPMTRGRNGSLTLRAASNSPSAARLAAPLLQHGHERADTGRLERVDRELVFGAGSGKW